MTVDELRSRMRAIMAKAADEGRPLTAAEEQEVDRLAAAIVKEQARLRRRERRKAKRLAQGGTWHE